MGGVGERYRRRGGPVQVDDQPGVGAQRVGQARLCPLCGAEVGGVAATAPQGDEVAACGELKDFVQEKLEVCRSPEQISRTLAESFPERPEMQVSHETIYQALFVQSRGELRRELHRKLRTGRAVRRPRGQRGRGAPDRRVVPNMVMVSERAAEASLRRISKRS